MKRQLSFSLTRYQALFSSSLLRGSFLALVSSTILGQPVLADNTETYYFGRFYQESGYRLDGTFTATDVNFDNIISEDEVTEFAALLESLNDGWKESIDFKEDKNIIDFHYDIDSYLTGDPDLKFQVDTIENNNKSTTASLPITTTGNARRSFFPMDSSWQVNFNNDVDLFRVQDFIIAGQDSSSTGIVTFIDDGGVKTPDASSLGGIALGLLSFLGLKRKK